MVQHLYVVHPVVHFTVIVYMIQHFTNLYLSQETFGGKMVLCPSVQLWHSSNMLHTHVTKFWRCFRISS